MASWIIQEVSLSQNEESVSSPTVAEALAAWEREQNRRRRISVAQKGRVFSDEHRAALSAGQQRRQAARKAAQA